jgi:hypothetical protein
VSAGVAVSRSNDPEHISLRPEVWDLNYSQLVGTSFSNGSNGSIVIGQDEVGVHIMGLGYVN